MRICQTSASLYKFRVYFISNAIYILFTNYKIQQMKNLDKSRKLSHVAVLGILLGILLAGATSLGYGMESQPVQYAVAQNDSADSAQLQTANVTGDLTEATGGNVFGGQAIGDVEINSDGHQADINGQISATPAEGNVFEAWLEDAGGSGYRLSLGQVLENGTVQVSQHMVNPFTYTIFYITEEPENDSDPNPADAKAGLELEAPFGQ